MIANPGSTDPGMRVRQRALRATAEQSKSPNLKPATTQTALRLNAESRPRERERLCGLDGTRTRDLRRDRAAF